MAARRVDIQLLDNMTENYSLILYPQSILKTYENLPGCAKFHTDTLKHSAYV